MIPNHKSLMVSSEEWTLAIIAFLSITSIRGVHRRWSHILAGAATIFVLVYVLPHRLWLLDVSPSYLKVLRWTPEDGSAGVKNDLRMVVFGGGNIATVGHKPAGFEDQSASWTEVLCRELDCASYKSYIPRAADPGGSVTSNVVYDMTLNHTLASRNVTDGAAYDYSWLSTEYPSPLHLPDLQQQVNSFLANEPATHPTQETLWVFDFGFWDVWRLSAFPQDISFQLVEVLAAVIFQDIDRLYQASLASMPNPSAKHSMKPTRPSESTFHRPFRVIIPRLFDVSLAPGFETARFRPPPPHTQADELRNAAYLTKHWDSWMDEMTEKWLGLNMPTVIDVTASAGTGFDDDDDESGPGVIQRISSRREVINPNVFKYLLELIADRQLKDSGIEDSRGRGKMPADQSFGHVDEACLQPNATAAAVAPGILEMVPCTEAEEYLFWDGFTVGPRAIRTIGARARDLIERHIEVGAPWLKKPMCSTLIKLWKPACTHNNAFTAQKT
ncbi:uncharacterized protein PG998_009618 [Apiospora kogelbergensis]|uniref:uncharacterized protein n=1 Tax=Apiospora kogelbergensis TaxID=1337665 RepID=UPI00312F6368